MSAKQDQVLIIEPAHELCFHGPFTTAVSAVMSLRNPSDRKVCFKIKTTAPKRYCVKPNSGVIDPKQEVQVAVSLQPFEYDPNEKNRHKFMVQAMFAPEGEINPDTLWKEADDGQIMDSKLKCMFKMPDSGDSAGVTAAVANGAEKTSNEIPSSVPTKPSSPKEKPEPRMVEDDWKDSVSYANTGENTASDESAKLAASIDEIKRLQETASALRHENLQLKEEALRLKRLASAREGPSTASSSSSSSNRNDAFTVQAMSPNATDLSTTYIYAALVVLVIGIIIGKWIF